MKSLSLELPQHVDEWTDWLERQLVGLDLADVILELEAVAEAVPNGCTETNADTAKTESSGGLATGEPSKANLMDVCGTTLSAVLQTGMRNLSEDQLRQLLQQPRLLLVLQESVLEKGSDYWGRLASEGPAGQRSRNAWSSIAAELVEVDTSADHLEDRVNQLEEEPARSASLNQTAAEVTPHASAAQRWTRRDLLRGGSLISASVIVIGIGYWWVQGQPSATGWGFDQSGLADNEIGGAEYLQRLAAAARQWTNKRPRRAKGLSKRLGEFSHGCETLLAAGHRPLTDDDREWLLTNCREWKTEIDKLRADLDSEKQTYEEVRTAADELVEEMVKTLEQRSREVVGSVVPRTIAAVTQFRLAHVPTTQLDQRVHPLIQMPAGKVRPQHCELVADPLPTLLFSSCRFDMVQGFFDRPPRHHRFQNIRYICRRLRATCPCRNRAPSRHPQSG